MSAVISPVPSRHKETVINYATVWIWCIQIPCNRFSASLFIRIIITACPFFWAVISGAVLHVFREQGGGPGAVVKTACLEGRRSRVWAPLRPSRFKEANCFFPAHSWRYNIVGNLHDRELACAASDHRGSNCESRVWRAVPSHSSHRPQEITLAQFSLYVHKGGQNRHPFHFREQRRIYCHLGIKGSYLPFCEVEDTTL